MPRVVLCTGGNLGDVAGNLARARCELAERIGPETAASVVMVSEPWGFAAENDFLNQILVLDTELAPEEVLDHCQAIESEMGRVREPGKGYLSRTMDIDILFYGSQTIDTPRLRIPHPQIARRAFVLDPLVTVLPDFVHPTLGKTIRQLHGELYAELRTESGNGEKTPAKKRKESTETDPAK